MEKITTYNYEAFYLDYLEDNLSDKEKSMLFEFLNQHPDLKAELEFDGDILDYSLPTDFKTNLKQIEKESLKHCDVDEICLNNVDEFMIADIEGQLLSTKTQELEQFIKQHHLGQTFNTYKATKLKPNLEVVYSNKKELKHQTKIIPLLIRITAVAALLLLLINVININSTHQNKYQQRQAKYQYQKPNFDINTTINNKADEVQQIEQIAKSNSNKPKVNSNASKTPTNVITPKEDLQQNQIVEQPKINKKHKIDTTSNINNNPQILPIKDVNQQDNDDNIASIKTTEEKTSNIKLVDMYPPVTQVANNYTSLNVMAKKSTPESEYQVTQIKIGKFSFERKKKK